MFVFAFTLIVIILISLYRVKAFNTKKIIQSTCFEIIAKYLHLSDLSCAIYISLIAAGNIYLKLSITAYALDWRGHVVCFISCILYIYFQMTSIAVILFMALAKWLVAKYPLTSRLKHISFITLCLRYISITLLIFSVSLTLFYTFNSDLHVLPNSLCTIFYDTRENTVSQYLALFLGFIQLTASIVVLVLHLLLYVTSYKSLNVLRNDSKLLSFRRMTFQIIFTAFCKFTCWFPSGITYILSVSVDQFPMKILLYTIVSATSFNLLVNPFFAMIVNRKE